MRTVTIGASDTTERATRSPRAARHGRRRRRYSDRIASTSDRRRHVPDPIFTPEDGLAELWVKAYQGEVLGELCSAPSPSNLDDPDQAAKMRMLATLERRTKEATAPALERAGLPTEPDPETQATADGAVARRAAMTWSDLMATIGPITAQYIPLYQRIGELSPAERETADLLVAHEAALRDFARAEIAGDRVHLARADHGAGPHALSGPAIGSARSAQLSRPGPAGGTPAWNPGTHPPYHGGEGHGPCRPLSCRGRTRRPLPRPCRGRSLSRPG